MSEKETKRSKRKKEQKHDIEPILIDDDERILHLNPYCNGSHLSFNYKGETL